MYEDFFGLRERPFELAADPRYLLLTPTHHEALSHLQHGLDGGYGMTLLLGAAGTGKSTLLRAAPLARSHPHDAIVLIANPGLTRGEFLELLADGFHLTAAAASSKTRLLAELTTVLESTACAGGRAALVVDEAQALSEELLEEIRLLSNASSPSVPYLPVILAGQLEFGSRLRQPALAHLKQRIGLRYILSPLDLNDTARYIAGRITMAGGVPVSVFTAGAVQLIHRRSSGIARTISVLCNHALTMACADGRQPVDVDVVEHACAALDVDIAAAGTRVNTSIEHIDPGLRHAPGGASAAGQPAMAGWR